MYEIKQLHRSLNPLYLTNINYRENPNDFYNLISSKDQRQNLLKLSYFHLDNLSKFIAEFYDFVIINNLIYINGHSPVIFGIPFSEIHGRNKETRLLRLSNYEFIYKKVVDLYNSLTDTNSINILKCNDYLSPFGKKILSEKEEKQHRYLNSITVKDMTTGNYILDNDGNILTMLDLQEGKKETKLAELYFAQKSLENLAKMDDMTFLFVTLTLPPIFKPNPLNGNCTYDKNLSVKDGINFLNEIWRQFQQYKIFLEKKNYDKLPNEFKNKVLFGNVFGFGCKEPQSDGTPHSHYLMYCDKKDRTLLNSLWLHCCKTIFDNYDYKYSKGISIKIIEEDKNKKGSPSSYIFKYIMKSLGVNKYETMDGRIVETKENQEELDKNIGAYKLHKYRRYSFFGVQQVFGKWKEFKRLTLDNELKAKLNLLIDKIGNKELKTSINNLKQYCIDNNYLSFFKMLKSDIFELKIKYKISINKYGEEQGTPEGLELIFKGKSYFIETRKKWKVVPIK